jgi:cysteinyl-tRNA synthetase
MEDFVPLVAGEIKMYACGVTTYDEIHIGHARQAITFDIIRNYFEYTGNKVTYVRNFTDIDDKIINRANKEGRDAMEVSDFYVNETIKDLELLKVRHASFEPRVTQCIPDIIAYIKDLIASGHAYVSDGEVLFSVDESKDYGKLSNRNKDELISLEDTSNKKKSYDFALWKPAKPGEPSWDSPWGAGRPGWHIECSVMADKYLGKRIDIHGGGVDLVFPHHENEIAQSEAHNGEQFANYWIHNGLVMIAGTKMSKSLGNFLTVKDALSRYQPEEIRYAVMTQNCSSELDFSIDLFINARKRMYYFYSTLLRLESFVAANAAETPSGDVAAVIASMESDFRKAMEDNFNTAKVLASFSEIFTEINRTLIGKELSIASKLASIKAFQDSLKAVASVLHILEESPSTYIKQLEDRVLAENNVSRDEISYLVNKRQEAKLAKDYAESDRIRDELLSKKVSLQDTGSQSTWEVLID